MNEVISQKLPDITEKLAGLGFLAADHIKECSDLGVPVTAVGFRYPGGYVRQKIRDNGWQQGSRETIDMDASPLTRVWDKSGEQLVVKIPLIEPPRFVAVWKVAVGRVTLYLMYKDIEMNDPWNRGISARSISALQSSDCARRCSAPHLLAEQFFYWTFPF
jgi:starch phosphorylase